MYHARTYVVVATGLGDDALPDLLACVPADAPVLEQHGRQRPVLFGPAAHSRLHGEPLAGGAVVFYNLHSLTPSEVQRRVTAVAVKPKRFLVTRDHFEGPGAKEAPPKGPQPDVVP